MAPISRPPLACRLAIGAASLVAPGKERAGWRSRWQSGLSNWWVLVERGDVSVRSSGDVCRAALADAWRERFGRVPLERWLRGPSSLLLAALFVPALVAAITRGLAYTRLIPSGTDRLFGHAFLFCFALAAAVFMVIFRGARPAGRGWRYWTFLAVKTAALLAAVTLVWTEGGFAIRSWLSGGRTGVLFGGVLWGLAYVAAFVCTAGWSFSDQRRRCPVCLRRLVRPVAIGSWSSVFDPAVTELICEDGHGMLCADDNEGGGEGRWTELDATWKGL